MYSSRTKTAEKQPRRMSMKKVTPVLFAALGGVLFLSISVLALTGAVFTTDYFGTVVNGNIYEAKEGVYLNGGPQPNAPCTSAGLADGVYYFRVTDPSGSALLSEDGVENRQFTVYGGVIVSTSGTHAVGIGNCPGSISIQLMPFEDTPNAGGEYKVTVSTRMDFHPSASKSDNFKIRPSPEHVSIIGKKFYDANVNGVFDAGEVVIAGWKILKVPPTPADETYTSANGQYSFIVEPYSGFYTISEVMPNSLWRSTTQTWGTVAVDSSNVAGPDFGNVCLGAGGGYTIGFWTNKNGQQLIEADDLAKLRSLPLRNIDGSDFDPTSAGQLAAWLKGSSSYNMAYMLSAQLAALSLSVHNGFVSKDAWVYAPRVPGANLFAFITVEGLMSAAITQLEANPITLEGYPWRVLQEQIKNALDEANNNKSFVQSAPCMFTTPY
jgi:hypothetical protein